MATKGLPPSKIACGDRACLLKQVPDPSIDQVTAPPPYCQRRSCGGGEDGSERSIKSCIDAAMEVFVECVGAAKDTGGIAFNTGDKWVGGRLEPIPRRFALEAKPGAKLDLISEMTRAESNHACHAPAEKNGAAPDPYTGGGTAAAAAKKSGRDYVGIGISPRRCDAAQGRVGKAP